MPVAVAVLWPGSTGGSTGEPKFPMSFSNILASLSCSMGKARVMAVLSLVTHSPSPANLAKDRADEDLPGMFFLSTMPFHTHRHRHPARWPSWGAWRFCPRCDPEPLNRARP